MLLPKFGRADVREVAGASSVKGILGPTRIVRATAPRIVPDVRAEVSVPTTPATGIAPEERRLKGPVELWKHKLPRARHPGHTRGVPAHPEDTLQKIIHAIERTAHGRT